MSVDKNDIDYVAEMLTDDPDKFSEPTEVSEGFNMDMGVDVKADATDALSSLFAGADPQASKDERADELKVKEFEADQAAGRFDYNSNEAKQARRELNSDKSVSHGDRDKNSGYTTRKHTMKEIRFLELMGYGKTDIPWDAQEPAAHAKSVDSFDELDESVNPDISHVADMLTDDPDKFIEPTSEGVEEDNWEETESDDGHRESYEEHEEHKAHDVRVIKHMNGSYDTFANFPTVKDAVDYMRHMKIASDSWYIIDANDNRLKMNQQGKLVVFNSLIGY